MDDRSGSSPGAVALNATLDALLASQAVRQRLAEALGWGRAPVTAAALHKMAESPDLVQRGIAFGTVRALQTFGLLPPEPTPPDTAPEGSDRAAPPKPAPAAKEDR